MKEELCLCFHEGVVARPPCIPVGVCGCYLEGRTLGREASEAPRLDGAEAEAVAEEAVAKAEGGRKRWKRAQRWLSLDELTELTEWLRVGG